SWTKSLAATVYPAMFRTRSAWRRSAKRSRMTRAAKISRVRLGISRAIRIRLLIERSMVVSGKVFIGGTPSLPSRRRRFLDLAQTGIRKIGRGRPYFQETGPQDGLALGPVPAHIESMIRAGNILRLCRASRLHAGR